MRGLHLKLLSGSETSLSSKAAYAITLYPRGSELLMQKIRRMRTKNTKTACPLQVRTSTPLSKVPKRNILNLTFLLCIIRIIVTLRFNLFIK